MRGSDFKSGDPKRGPLMARSHLDLERALAAWGVDVPKYPACPTFFEAMAGASVEADFLSACERWESEIKRLFRQLLIHGRREGED